jgi:hypothetical protein
MTAHQANIALEVLLLQMEIVTLDSTVSRRLLLHHLPTALGSTELVHKVNTALLELESHSHARLARSSPLLENH